MKRIHLLGLLLLATLLLRAASPETALRRYIDNGDTSFRW